MKYNLIECDSKIFNFNYCWKFLLADAFPLKDALDARRDSAGRFFYEIEYDDSAWKDVGIPHTFNDSDIFVNRIEDAGTGQKRTFSFYRKSFKFNRDIKNKKVIIESEGVRQTCYLYVNGKMAGFSENGVAPFAFDISAYVAEGDNLIAIATDNTASRNIDVISAETPNINSLETALHDTAMPGAFLSSQTKDAQLKQCAQLKGNPGVSFFWNCNDFNPSIGGLTKNINLHVKNKIYLTLNVYSNLRTKGVYIYAGNFDFEKKEALISFDAEVRNETGKAVTVEIQSVLVDHNGGIAGIIKSGKKIIEPAILEEFPPLTIIPKDAYILKDEQYKPVDDEAAVAPSMIDSLEVTVVSGSEKISGLNFWNVNTPYLYDVYTHLIINDSVIDIVKTTTGFRKIEYNGNGKNGGLFISGERTWLTGYAQRSSNEWAAIGCAPDWLKDLDAQMIRQSNANHIRWMHVAACPADIRSCDRYGIVCTQPAGDKERESFGRQWDMRIELMRDVIIYFRNSPSIFFWEIGNNSVNKEHMREASLLRKKLDPHGGRLMGCRSINKREVVQEAEYVSTMLNRHAGRFQSELMPVLETEYSREESPRRVWDDFSPPDFDYDNLWAGRGGQKGLGVDVHDLTSEEFAVITARSYSEFFNDRMGGASKKNLYSAAAALCWTDSAQHGRQSASENARMSGRVDAVRLKKQNFDVFRVMQSGKPEIKILGHWNYPEEDGVNYRYPLKKFENGVYVETGEFAFRCPKKKSVYVAGSYSIARIELFVNGKLKGVCDRPDGTFIYRFENINVTESGSISAKGYAYDGSVCGDEIRTTGKAAQIKLIPQTGAKGFLADGADIMYFDIEITDDVGNICPLCFDRIDFELKGDALFLGGYSSGRFNGYGKNDSPIHQNFVFTECGTNRVFIRAGTQEGEISLTAKMNGIIVQEKITSVKTPVCALYENEPQLLEAAKIKNVHINSFEFNPISAADAVKYVPDNIIAVSIVVNDGFEVAQGVYMDGAIWGPILQVLSKLDNKLKMNYTYDEQNRKLTVKTASKEIIAQCGYTHLIVNNEENLMGGEPVLKQDNFWMEINAIISKIDGIKAQYDEKVSVYRIDM